jgi:hypothetical protein
MSIKPLGGPTPPSAAGYWHSRLSEYVSQRRYSTVTLFARFLG